LISIFQFWGKQTDIKSLLASLSAAGTQVIRQVSRLILDPGPSSGSKAVDME